MLHLVQHHVVDSKEPTDLADNVFYRNVNHLLFGGGDGMEPVPKEFGAIFNQKLLFAFENSQVSTYH